MYKESEITGAVARQMRVKSGLDQGTFWGVFGVTQSGGSRYESGRNIPKPVRLLVAGCSSTKGLEALAKRLWTMNGCRVLGAPGLHLGFSSTEGGRRNARVRKAVSKGHQRQHAA